ncbi:sarcosine oxidase subunit gamma [Bradyrhizobium prioriisuperbiae]|uniref:sarcosine oxidase subunit gamma n=1 Tax=Bradyrhizobium prioriisuperbiae TaxID=2854389 RepID=UPI0028E69F29|nr:sarcosine oxidase subunit gamma family protein [Bradyrhizobium prioritasuperba]
MSAANSVVITEQSGLGLAAVMSRKGVRPAAIGAALGLAPSEGPGRVGDARLALIGTGPGTWLALTEAPDPDWSLQLAHKLTGLASVSDQSGGYMVFRIGGNGARALLQHGAFIDFHPDVFRQGSAATTVIAHIGVILWQRDDTPTFDVATFRSYAHSFRRWVETTAAAL